MTFWILIRRSLRFHARAHFGVVLGAAIGSAALIGALVVGDSVRETLRGGALQRLANASFALAPTDRTFSSDLSWQFYSGSGGPATWFKAIFPADANKVAAGAVVKVVDRRQGIPPPETNNTNIQAPCVSLLCLPGMASAPSADARANHIQVYGVSKQFWIFANALQFFDLPKGSILLNRALADQLGAQKGDTIVVRASRPGRLSLETAFAQRQDQSVAVRRTVGGVLPPECGGDLSLKAGGPAPFNAFVPLEDLSALADTPGQANLLLSGPVAKTVLSQAKWPVGSLRYVRRLWNRFLGRQDSPSSYSLANSDEALDDFSAMLQSHWSLQDAQLTLGNAPEHLGLELRSSRVFLEAPVVDAVDRMPDGKAIHILTYLANLISAGTNSTPYSMVTAADPPYTPANMRDDEIVVNQWLAEDLRVRAGDMIELGYFLPESGAQLLEATNRFRVREIVPLEGIYADRTLMPDFPGIEKAETTHDWDAGFPLAHKIRPKDEEYWKEHRGTPKAFVTLAAGRRMWANRFGVLTAIRIPDPPGMATAEHWGRFKDKLLATLKPEDLGLRFEPVREQALKAAEQSQDFGQLFLGFSFFLVIAALLLMALLFQFGLEQRVMEIGTLLALGFTPKQVRRLLLFEGVVLALAGGILGALGGLGYAKAMLWGLTTVWRSAIGPSALEFHASAVTLLVGVCASTVVAALTIWLALRRQARQPVTALLAGELERPKVEGRRPKEGRNPKAEIQTSEFKVQSSKLKVQYRAVWIAVGAGLGAAVIVGWMLVKGDTANAEAFFSAGALLLIAGLATVAVWLRRLASYGNRAEPSDFDLRPSFGLRTSDFGLLSLGLRSCARRRTRSLATVALLACGCFLIVAIGVFRLDANRDASLRSSGTGGFALLGESTMPVLHDLNTAAGQGAFGLSADQLPGISVVQFRLREGDDASCLNLNRAQKPRLLGVRPELLAGRFTFAKVVSGDRRDGWELLRRSESEKSRTRSQELVARNGRSGEKDTPVPLTPTLSPGEREQQGATLDNPQSAGLADRRPTILPLPSGEGRGEGDLVHEFQGAASSATGAPRSRIGQRLLASTADEIPAIGDANSIEWALGKKVGDTLDYTDERGRTFKLRLVGAMANSILQGSLIIDEAAFTQKFPNESGYRVFLLDAPSNSVSQISATLTRALQDVGLELTPTAQRLNAFNAVQNTYLGTFQVLGGLGLLLGSAGLGVVVLRNVLERRGELGLVVAVGFRRRTLHSLVLCEHGALLGLGLAIGLVATCIAVLPALLKPGTQLPYSSLALTLGAVLLNGAAWTWVATRFALRGDLLAALRNE